MSVLSYFPGMTARVILWPVLPGLLLLAACAEFRPDALEVYPNAAGAPRRPVIIIPGVFGSRLMDARTDDVVWGRFRNLFTSRFKLILSPMRSQWTDLLDLPIETPIATENRDSLVAGYRWGDIKGPRPGGDCFAFYYDWRRDVVENARLLGEAIAWVQAVTPGATGGWTSSGTATEGSSRANTSSTDQGMCSTIRQPSPSIWGPVT